MQFGLIRVIDKIVGRAFFFLLAPLCRTIASALPESAARTPRISFIKLHGGGSLLIAMPALLGLRQTYPTAIFTLIGTADTRKYAELTGLFDRYVLIDQHNLLTLLLSGLRALAASMRQSICIDLEPHSFLAAVFTLLTLSARRLGFVKTHEFYRASAYTDALYFNPVAPIYVFYDQLVARLGAQPAAIDLCRAKIQAAVCGITPTPLAVRADGILIYLSPFCSDFATERMMPDDLWPRLMQQEFGEAVPATILIGGGQGDWQMAERLKKAFDIAWPQARSVNLCGQRSLGECAADIQASGFFWGLDSGPLHIARLLGQKCFSFWGPTNPADRLRPMPGLIESTSYLGFACSPCIYSTEQPPCRGNNQCMRRFMDPPVQTPAILIDPQHRPAA